MQIKRNVPAGYVVKAADHGSVFLLASGNTVTLPAATPDLEAVIVVFKRTPGAGSATITGTVDGQTDLVLTARMSRVVGCSGGGWGVLAGYL